MNKHLIAASAALSVLGMALPAAAAVSLTSAATPYTQSFDSLASTAWANDMTLPGWSLFTAAGNAISSIVIGNGGGNAGGFYSFGVTGSSERALGGLGSGGTYFGSPANGALAGYIVLAVTNQTGLTLASASVQFDGEQWRNGGNTAAHGMAMEYGFGASYATAGWSGPSVAWTSPVATGTAAAVNGNGAGLVAGVTYGISTAWAPGETLWLRWHERNETGSDHGLAIDNLQLSVTAVPEPETYALMLAGLADVGMLARRRA